MFHLARQQSHHGLDRLHPGRADRSVTAAVAGLAVDDAAPR